MLIDVEKWREIFGTLKQHKLRTLLTAFGVFWGIFMLTVLLGAGKGLENGIKDGFPPVSNFIYIWGGSRTQIPYQGMPIGRQIGLTQGDVAAIERDVDSVGMIKGQNSLGVWGGSSPYTVHGSKNGAFSIVGGFQGVENIEALKIVEGRSINWLDEQQRRKVALIGQRVRDQLFADGEPHLGSSITINGISFQVVGVFESLQQDNQKQQEERVFLPNDTLRYTFNQTGWVGSIMIIPRAGVNASVTEEEVKKYLAQRKKVSPDDKGVFGSYNLQADYDKVQGLFIGIKLFSWVVAIGTILAGAVGVGNIMLIVKERTREIGLRKALGATPASVVAMIMQESLFITAIAGYGGLVVGALSIESVARILNNSGGGAAGMFSRPEVDFKTAMLALFVLILSGLLASLLPAAKAAAVNPVLALQDE